MNTVSLKNIFVQKSHFIFYFPPTDYAPEYHVRLL